MERKREREGRERERGGEGGGRKSMDREVSLAGAATSIIFVVTKVLMRQTHVCSDKPMFVMTKHVCCYDKSMLVVTKLVS